MRLFLDECLSPGIGRALNSEGILRTAIGFLSKRGDPLDVMVNHVLEVTADTELTLYPISTQER